MKKLFLFLSVCLLACPASAQDVAESAGNNAPEEMSRLGNDLQKLQKKHNAEYEETVEVIKNKTDNEKKLLERFMNDINVRAHKKEANGKVTDLDEMLEETRDLSSYYELKPLPKAEEQEPEQAEED